MAKKTRTHTTPTKKEITYLMKEGWYFRIKTVKKYRYITARKNNAERILETYNDKTWSLIQTLKEKKEKVEPDSTSQTTNNIKAKKYLINFDNFTEELHRYFWVSKLSRCLFIGENRYCRYWKLKELPPFIQQSNEFTGDDYFKLFIDVDGSKYWRIKAIGLTCKNCPAFLDTEIIDLINERLKNTPKD